MGRAEGFGAWVGAGVVALGLVGVGVPAGARAGQPSVSAGRAARPVLVTGGAEEWERQAAAVERLLPMLDQDGAARRRPDLHRAVAELLAREAAAREQMGASALPPARRAHGDLLMVVGLRLARYADAETRPLLLRALVTGPFAPESRFAADLASFGAFLAEDVTALATDPRPATRANAYVVMGRILNGHGAGCLDEPLTIGQALDLATTLRAGLDDEDDEVRLRVIASVVAAGDVASARTLAEIARIDLNPRIRTAARTAMGELLR